MSKQMMCSFFPATCIHFFQPHLSFLHEFLYPEDVVDSCPEQVLSIPGFGIVLQVRRPFLAVFAILGISVGLLGALRIHVQQQQSHSTRPQGHSNASSPPQRRRQDSRFYWMLAFLFFGLMNLSGLCLHCLLPATGNSPLERPLFWVGDTYTTGAFGMALWAAAMMECKNGWNAIGWAFGNVLGLLAIVWFLVFGYEDADESTVSFPGSLPLEMWYGVSPVVFAAYALVWMLIRTRFNRTLCIAFALSYLVFCISAFDSFFCRQFGNLFLDLLTTPTLAFLATDVLFLGIALWLEEERAVKGSRPSGKEM